MTKTITVNEKYEPKVSVAIAIYNGSRFLREQIDSILNQTYRNLEVVVSDDGSDDDTQDILNDYATRDKRLRWSISKSKRGMVSNFSEAISLCKGDIIFLCDCDDVWHESKIEKHVKIYGNQNVHWVANKVVITDEKNNPTGYLTDTMPDYYEKSRQKILYYTWGSCIIGCATSYRASILKNIWPADICAPGHDSWIQMAISPANYYLLDEVLQTYRQHANNTVGLKAGNESLAIKNNMIYLKSLVWNNRVQLWKRFLFLIVFIGKKIRKLLINK